MKRARDSEDNPADQIAERMRALGRRLLTKYGVVDPAKKYDSAMTQTVRGRDTTSVWGVRASRVLVQVKDVLWTNIVASQCMLERAHDDKQMIESVVSDYKHLWKLAETSADDVRPFMNCTTGVNWVTGAQFQLSDEQFAMIMTFCDGAPIDTVDVTARYSKGGKKSVLIKGNPAAPGACVRSAAWLYSTMGSGKSIVAWFAARHFISDAEWTKCRSTELKWAGSNLNGGDSPTVSKLSPTSKNGVFSAYQGLVKRVVWIVCKDFMMSQWYEVIKQNLGLLDMKHVHVLVNHSDMDVRRCAALMQSDDPKVIISTGALLTKVSNLCPLRVVCIVHDELASMETECMRAYRTLFVSATPAGVFNFPLSKTMAEMMYGNSSWMKIDSGASPERRAMAWARFAQMNPMPDVQIENSMTAIAKMPAYLEVENIPCKLWPTFGNMKPFANADMFYLNIFHFPKHFTSHWTVHFSRNVWNANDASVPYGELQSVAASLLKDVEYLNLLPEPMDDRQREYNLPRRDDSVILKLTRPWAGRLQTLNGAFKKTIRSLEDVASATGAWCILCGESSPVSQTSVVLCCGSCFCAKCAEYPGVQRPCCFCVGHYVPNPQPAREWGLMTAVASAFRSLRIADPTITKFFIVAPGAPQEFIDRFVEIALTQHGSATGSAIPFVVHSTWTVEIARACAENPARIDVLMHTHGGEVDGLDMGIVDAIITVGPIKNKQQLYSRVLRAGTMHREKMRIVQVAGDSDDERVKFTSVVSATHTKHKSNAWNFIKTNLPVQTYPLDAVVNFEDKATGVAGIMKECGAPILLDGEQWGDAGAPIVDDESLSIDAWGSVVTRVVITFKGGDGAHSEASVDAPPVASVGGCADAIDFKFIMPLDCELIPPKTDSVHLRRLPGSAGPWFAEWSCATSGDRLRYDAPRGKLPKQYAGKADTICLRVYTQKEVGQMSENKVFTVDNVKLEYESVGDSDTVVNL